MVSALFISPTQVGTPPITARPGARVLGAAYWVLGIVARSFAVFLMVMCLRSGAQADRETVRGVHFDGVHALSEDALRKGLVMRSGMPVDRVLVVGDMKRILAHYQALGYWLARVHFPDIVVEGGKATIRFRIDENARTRVDSMVMGGEMVFSQETVQVAVTMTPGTVLTTARLDEQLNILLQFYENRGYPFCALEPEVVFSQNKVHVGVDVTSGPLCVIDTVVFEGNVVTRSNVLLREMRLKVGTIYDRRQVDRAVRYLRRLPFLISVDEPDVIRKGDLTTLVVRVQEARTARVEGGVGYAPQGAGGGLTGAFALHVHNAAGAGRLGQVSWKRTGVGASDLQVRLQEPWVLNKPVSADFELEMGQRLGYSEWAMGVGATARSWEGGTAWGQVSRRRVVPDSLGMGLYEESNLWAVTVGTRVDHRDDMWNPRQGWIGQASFELGRVEGVRSAAIRRLQSVNTQFFYAAGVRSVWAIAGQGMWVSQAGGVPDDARIRVGGANSIRGYREEAFWATEAGWVSLEWRYLVGARSRLFGFVDAGVLQDLIGRVIPVGYGVGIVLQSQMGMIGFDVGWAREDGFGDGKVHVRLVNAF